VNRKEIPMLKKIVPMLAVALTILGLSLYASARNDTAVHGFVRSADRACFVEVSGAMQNICSTMRNIVVPAGQDRGCTVGAHFRVNAQTSNAASPVCCRVFSHFNGQDKTVGAYKCSSQVGPIEQFDLPGGLPWADRYYFSCDVYPNAKLVGVDWAPSGSCD
jgi:hypothetical protein